MRRRIILAAAAAAAPLIPTLSADAVDRYWVGGPGSANWLPGSWSAIPGGLPGATPPVGGDNALVNLNDLSIRTINYNGPNTPALTSLILNNAGGGNTTLSQAGLHLNANNQVIGTTGRGAYNLITGTNTAATLILGQSFGSQGVYSQTGGNLISNGQFIGLAGGGTFTQNGGTNTVNGTIFIANSVTGTNASTGTYNLIFGHLAGNTNTGTVNVGHGGIGAFNQSGGTVGIANLNVGVGAPAVDLQANGTYTLSNGSLTTTSQSVGVAGIGSFDHTGGSNVTDLLLVGTNFTLFGTNRVHGQGTYSIDGPATLEVKTRLTVGAEGVGAFVQNGGAVSVNTPNAAGGLILGLTSAPGGSGTYTLQNGTLSVIGPSNSGRVLIGSSGDGTFNQSGGSHSVSNEILLGTNHNGTGFYNLSGGTLTSRRQSIGYRSTSESVFTQSGGSNNAAVLWIGEDFGSSGRYDLQAGTLNVSGGSPTSMIVGVFGAGVFNQGGGTVSASFLTVGGNANALTQVQSDGTYNLVAGSVTSNQLNVGSSGQGTFNQSGGAVSTGFFSIGTGITSFGTNRVQGDGTYNIGAGATLLVQGQMVLGSLGHGTFVQTGGTVTINPLGGAGGLTIASGSDSTGSYTLQSGTLEVLGSASAARERIGGEGAATFTQNGGTHNVGNWLFIGSGAGGTGTYTLNNGTLSSPGQSVGYLSTAQSVFTQNGGTNNASSFITIGDQAGARGRYNLRFGSLNPFTLNVAWQGFGVLEQSFGELNPGSLRLGHEPSGSGTVVLSGGTLLVGTPGSTTDTNTYVGLAGDGNFIQTGGIHTIRHAANALYIGALAGSTGAYSLSGGSIQVPGSVYVGFGGDGTFLQTGGTHNVTNRLYVAFGSSSTGSYTLTGGNLNAPVEIGRAGTFTQDEGNLTGNVINAGTFNRIGPGGFAGAFTQTPTGTLNTQTLFTLPSGLVNAGTINIPTSGSLVANATGLDNDGGAIVLSGGSLAGSGPLLNDGHISGFGTIGGASQFTNNGQLVQGGGVLVLNRGAGTINNGSIELAPLRQFRLETPLTNNGTLRMNSAVVNGAGTIVNTPGGLIAGGGTIHVPLTNQGTVLLNSATLNVVQPFTNSGVVELEDAAQLLGGAITNAGVMQGRGSIANAVSNQSRLEAVGGVLALTGPVTNPATGLLRAGEGATLVVINGLATNDGTIDLAGGTFDNNSKPLVNRGTLSGRGAFVVTSVTNSGTIALTSGSADVFGPLVNTGSGKVIVTGGAAASFHGALSGTAGTELRVSANSRGVFLAPVTGPMTITGLGDKYFEAGPSAVGPIAAGGATIVQAAATLTADRIVERSLTIKGDVTLRPGGGTSKVNELSIDAGASLDLASNPLIVDYTGDSSIQSIRSFILGAYAGGSWTGEGLTSSDVTADPRLGMAYGESSLILGPGGGTFEGESVDATAVLVRVTVKGDANLDNTVSFPDLVALAQNYGRSPGATWAMGDFTYDGVVNFPDLVALAQNYQMSFPLAAAGLPGIAGASPGFNDDLSRAFSSVPEPSLMPLGVMGLVCAGHRRRRRWRNR